MIQGFKWDFNGFFYRKRKHYCAICGELLTTIKQEKIINSESDEAKYYDFSNGDTYMFGNVKFINFALKCPSCDALYSIREQKELERNLLNTRPLDSFDVIAEITNCRATKTTFGNNYRGCCEIKKNYLTSCVIETLDQKPIVWEQTALCKISFITPKVYPASLWVGKAMDLYEGERIVGVMKITKVNNSILDRNLVFKDKLNILTDKNVLNKALSLSLEWGKEWLKPIQNRLMYIIPRLSGNDIEKISEYIIGVRDDIFEKIYNDHFDSESQTFDSDVVRITKEKYPWINKNNLSRLDSQGRYYAWHG